MFIETPNENDHVSGGRIQYHPDNPNIFEILTWTNLSKKTNRYNGYVSTWQIAKYTDPDTGTVKLGIFFLELNVRYTTSEWNKIVETPFSYIPDQHIRRAGREGREKLDLNRFDQVHIAIPKEEWEKWLIDPSDQVIGSSHTSNLAR